MPSLVASAIAGAVTSSPTTTTGVDTTGAHALRVWVHHETTGTPTISDSKGNTWAHIGTQIQCASTGAGDTYNSYVDAYQATGTVVVGTGHTFTSTLTNGYSTIGAMAVQYTGGAGSVLEFGAWSPVLDTATPFSASSDSPTTDALILAFGCDSTTSTTAAYDWTGSSFTEDSSQEASGAWHGTLAHRSVTAGTYTASFTGAASSRCVVGTVVVTEYTPQTSYPNADGTDGAWTPSTGSDLYAVIDDDTDTEYITTDSNSTCRGGMASLSTPVAGTQTFAFRASGSPAKKLIATLIEGASTSRGTVTVDPLTSTPTGYSFSPSGISNYADLDWQFEVADATSPPANTVSYVGANAAFQYDNATSPLAVTYPATTVSGEKLLLFIGQKPSTANGGTVNASAFGTLVGSLTGANDGNTGGYDTTLGADTGNVNIYCYERDADGTEGGTSFNLTHTQNNVLWTRIIRVSNPYGAWAATTYTTGKDTSGGTSVSIAGAADPGFTTGDLAVVAFAIPTDVTTPNQFSAESLSASGATFGSITEVGEADSTTGNDIGGLLCYGSVTAGTSTGAPTFTATAGGTTTNVRGPAIIVRLRGATPTEFGRVYTTKLTIPEAAGGAATHTTTGALTGQGASVSGTATHRTLHATSGVLSGQGASVAGTAAHRTLHTTSGVLTGQGAVISGTALRYRVHASSGALSGQGSLIAGSAFRYRQHPTSGALTGQGATISGTAAHSAPTGHTATGALAGQGSVISGVSLRYRQHAAGGALIGQGSILSGTVAHKTLHATSGALAGQGATIAGLSLRYRAFTSSGSLVGSGSVVSGVSDHSAPGIHTSSGDLVGAGSLVSGAATLTRRSVVGGGIPGRRKQERRILITLDGNRYLVPESELPKWVDDKAEEVVRRVLTRPIKTSKKVKKQKQERIPELTTKVDDSWVRSLVEGANNAIRAELDLRRQMDEDDVEILLMVA